MNTEEARIAFPIGATVRTNNRASREYGNNQFPVEGVIGTVLEVSDSLTIHVQFDDHFSGHHSMEPGHNGHCWYLGFDAIEVITMPGINETQVSPADIPRLRVTIARNPTAYNNPWAYRIENGPVVNMEEVKPYIDKSIIRRMGSRSWRNGMQSVVDRGINTYGIDPQVFIDAITMASLAKQARESTGTFSKSYYDAELAKVMVSEPMIVAIGDQLFTLQPKGSIKSGKAMAAIRDRITKAAKLMAERISVAAKAEAAGIIANGERQLQAARVKIEQDRLELKMAMIIPPWIAASGLKLRYNVSSSTLPLMVGIDIPTKITAWQLVRSWQTRVLGQNPVYHAETVRWTGDTIPRLSNYHYVTAWMPFDPASGKFQYQQTRIGNDRDDTGNYSLPHLSFRGCLELQGMPDRLTGIVEYNKIKAIMIRGCQEVNMNSLLESANSWHPDVYNQLPGNLLKMVKNGSYSDSDNITEDMISDAERTPVDQEARETFNIESLREARRARGEELPADIDSGIADVPVEDMLVETDTGREEA